MIANQYFRLRYRMLYAKASSNSSHSKNAGELHHVRASSRKGIQARREERRGERGDRSEERGERRAQTRMLINIPFFLRVAAARSRKNERLPCGPRPLSSLLSGRGKEKRNTAEDDYSEIGFAQAPSNICFTKHARNTSQGCDTV